MNITEKLKLNNYTSNIIPLEYTLSNFDKVRDYINILSWFNIKTS